MIDPKAGKWLKSVDKAWEDRIDKTRLSLRSDPTKRSIRNRFGQLAGASIQTAVFVGKSFIDVPRKLSSMVFDVGRVAWNVGRVGISLGENEEARQDLKAAFSDLKKDTWNFAWAAAKTTVISTLVITTIITLPYIGPAVAGAITVGGISYSALLLAELLSTKIVKGGQLIMNVSDKLGRALEYDQVNPERFSAQEKNMLSQMHKIIVSPEYPIETRREMEKQLDKYTKFLQEEKIGPLLTTINESKRLLHKQYLSVEEGISKLVYGKVEKAVKLSKEAVGAADIRKLYSAVKLPLKRNSE